MKHFRAMAAASALTLAGFSIQRAVYSNFAYHELGLTADQYGWVEAWRELPGLLSVVLALVAIYFTRARLQTASIVLIAAGLALFGWADSYRSLVIFTLIQSVGFHVWIPVQEAMVLELCKPEERGRWLGKINSTNAAAGLVGMGMVYLLANVLSTRQFFWMGAAAVLAGAIAASMITTRTQAAGLEPFIFRWRYRTYYVLQLLSGARRQVLITFGGFALVAIHGAPVGHIALLTAASSLLAIYTRPLFGRLIDRWGEGLALSLSYGLAGVVFLGYAFIPVAWIVYGLFIFDNTLLGMDIAITTHAGKLIDKQDLGPTLAMGLTVNHVTAVALPLTGGMVWASLGPEVAFTLGAAICAVAVVIAGLIGRAANRARTAAA